MGAFSTILLVIVAISFFTFVVFFGRIPALRHTPIGQLNRLLVVRIPRGLMKLDQRLTGGFLTTSCGEWATYLWNERHPTILIFFILVMAVPEVLFLRSAWSLMATRSKIWALILLSLPYIFLYLSAATDPGYITQENHEWGMSLYPYDYTIFYPGNFCRTCHLPKPARSKHCSICKKCVSKLDHHCIFINGCVGYGNQHYFILLLGTTYLLLAYATFLGFSLLNDQMHAKMDDWTFFGHGLSWGEYFSIWTIQLQGQVSIGCSTLLAMLTSPLVLLLFGYQIYLIWAGTTTNESLKWGDWKHELRQRHSHVYKRQLTAPEVPTRWPVDAHQILVRSREPAPPAEDITEIPGTGPWTRVRSLDDVENLYDIGFMDNLADVFMAESLRPRRHMPLGDTEL